MRLFVAVWPPEDVLDAVAALPRPAVVGVRWTRRDQWHVTLRFLGEVEEAALADVVAAIDALGLPAVRATLGPAVERLNPRIVSVPVAGLDETGPAVIEATAGFGKPPERRPFRGHLTLARLQGVRKWELADALGAPLDESWTVDALHVVRSQLSPKGARYETVAELPLDQR
jgi:2'-5' RNA ligase